MTKEEKQLLLIDLCARLPYDVQCEIGGLRYGPYTFTGEDVEDLIDGRTFKPYLRPMSSMAEEEINEFILISDTTLWLGDKRSICILSLKQMDWLNSHHFDYRGLIEKGLALEAPEGMYKTE